MHGFKQGQHKVRKIGNAKGRGWAVPIYNKVDMETSLRNDI